MPHHPRVVAIGESLIDIAPGASGDEEYPGGSPANVALALGRLGRSPVLATQFASDARGRVLREWLEASGVSIVASAPGSGRTSTARVAWDAERNASYAFDIDWDVTEAALAALPAADAVHIGSIATVLAPGADAVERFVASRAGDALVSFDPNARPQITPDAAAAAERVWRLAALSDVVKVSDEDLAWYRPGVGPLDAARSLVDAPGQRGPVIIAVTRGSDGAFILRGDETIAVSAPKVTVADTIAAGDTFTAGLIDALLSLDASGPSARERLRALTTEELRRAASWAATAAAIVVSRPGADPPTRSELESAAR